MINRSFEKSDDELALARSLHTLKSTNVHTDNVPKETSDSSNILTNINVDTSIIKLTNQMKKNFLLEKQDFDTYLKTNLTGKTQAIPLFYYSQRITNKRIVKGSK